MQKRRIGALILIGALVAPLALALEATTVVAPELPAAAASTVLPFNSSGWRYMRGQKPASDWRTTRRTWSSGTAPLGFGEDTGALGTTIIPGPSAELYAIYLQRPFALTTVPKAGLELATWADDGVVIFVNGTEVVREGVPSGTVNSKTPALDSVPSETARDRLIHAVVPASVLTTGTNFIAARVQAHTLTPTNITFDAQLTIATSGESDDSADAYQAGWGEPTWSDEFTYRDPATGAPAIDPEKWNVRGRLDLGLLPDAALPVVSQASVDTADVAHLRADWLDTAIKRPDGRPGAKWIWHKTAYIDQKKMKKTDMGYAQQYGRWEIRAKVPTGPHTYGSLAAFWLRNAKSGEIDIMEAWGYNAEAKNDQRIDTATTTVHTRTSGSGDQKYYWTHADYGAETPVWRDFHTWAFELTPTYAAIYCDGELLAKVTPKTHPNLWNANYFESPLHVRLNLHVGASADYWGLPDPNHKAWTQPLDFQVDYVRIWKFEG